MPSPELERLADRGLLKREPPGLAEIEGLIRSAEHRLHDAQRQDLSLDSRFDLAYNAAHALALAALRSCGYRAEKRYLVFQCLAHTLATPAATWRLLVKCHEERNQVEYEGIPNVSEVLLADLIAAARELLARVRGLQPPGDTGAGERKPPE
jgi:hypothetical protein